MKYLSIILITILFASSSSAEFLRFRKPDGDWMTSSNWQTQNSDGTWRAVDSGSLPGPKDSLLFCVKQTVAILSGDAGTVQYLKLGMGRDQDGSGLTLTEGASLTISDHHNYIGKISTATLTMNGGLITYQGEVSVSAEADGILDINNGVMRVEDEFFHNKVTREGTARTTLRGGLLDVNTMILNSGVVDIAGGTLRIRSVSKDQILQWFTDGLLTARGNEECIEDLHYTLTPWGEDGFEIKASEIMKFLG